MYNPEDLKNQPVTAEKTAEEKSVDENDIRLRLNSADGLELLPNMAGQLGDYFKNKNLKPEEFEAEVQKFDKFAEISRFYDIPVNDEDVAEVLSKANLNEGIIQHLEKNLDKMPQEQLANLLNQFPSLLEEITPRLEGSLARASDIDAYMEQESMSQLAGAIQVLREKIADNPKTVSQLVELQDDFKLLIYRMEPIINEFRGGPFRNLASQLEEAMDPFAKQIATELEGLKDKVSQSKISYTEKLRGDDGKFLNPKEFYEANS